MDHTLALIGRIHQGDKEARDTLFSENMGLVYSVARRFLGRGVEMEDLFQIGSIGLLKAVDHFNPEFDVKFSTYAVPMIIGEIKRFLRDDGILKVSRSIKENQYKICKMREELEKKLGREPDLRELSDAMDMPMEELAMTLESAAEVDSIYKMGLVYSVARRFLGRGVEMEDLFQIGSIGLLKAVDHFNPEFDVKFSTYAVPMIIGEIKRFLRDDGILKVSRSIKENQYKICKMREELEKKLGREPDLRELSDAMDMPMEELAMTLESAAEVDSIYKTVYQGDGTDLQLVDRLPEKEDRHEKLLNRIFLEEILEKLEGDEKRLIVFRYFQDMTQTEVAKKMGMSQVQISRMEKRILKKLREISHQL